MKKGLKASLIGTVAASLLTASAFAADVTFTDYDSSNGYKSVYVDSPLGCSYESSLEQRVNNYGKDWKMKSAVTSHGENYKGEYVLNGYSKLISKSWLTGFTGATFVNVKDANGQEMYLASVKTMNPIATVNVSSDQAEAISWGVNPGRLKLYVAGYKYKKVLWWKVKIPIIKSKVVAKKRTINWSITLPKYVLDRDIQIELINVHTPTHRVIAALKDSGTQVASFVLANGIATKELYEKAQAGTLTYDDVENYINNSLAWAEAQNLITHAKSRNITNIMAAISEIIANEGNGFKPANHDELVNIAFNITSIISSKNFNPASLNSLIDSIEEVCQDKSGFVPANLAQVETILVNLEGLIGDNLSDKQAEVYENIVSVIAAINDWNEVALSEHQTAIFNGMRLVVDLYEEIHDGTITATQAEVLLNTWLDELAVVINAEIPQQAAAFNNFRTNVLANIFNVLITLENNTWI